MLSGSPCATEMLTILELDNCPLLTDTALSHLISCHNLQRIELYDCQLITRAGIQRLKVSNMFWLLLQGGHKPGKPGILSDSSEHGKLREFSGNSVQPQGKIVTNKVFLVRHSNICVKQLFTG